GLEHLLGDGSGRLEASQRERVDGVCSATFGGELGGDAPDRRSEREPVPTEAGDDDQADRPRATVEDGEAVWGHVDDAGPVAADAYVAKPGDDPTGGRERVVHQLAVRRALDLPAHVLGRAD